jgi:hypothetical protein
MDNRPAQALWRQAYRLVETATPDNEVRLMLSVSLKSKDTGILQDALASIPGAVDLVGVRVLNSTATALKNQTPRWVAEEYNIKVATIKKYLTVDRASKSYKKAVVVGKGNKGIPLKEFSTKEYQSGSSTKPGPDGRYTPAIGVPVQIKKSAGMEAEPGLFTQTMMSGHVGLFKHVQGNPKKIKEKFFPTPLYILDKPRYDKRVEEFVDNEMQDRLTEKIAEELSNV